MKWGFMLIVLVGLVTRAWAAPASEEDKLLQKGVDLREAGDEVHAVLELQKAYDLNHSPKAAAQLGLSEWALGRWVDAEAHVTEALRANNDSYLRDRQRRQVLEQALRTIRTHLGSLEITGDPDGAEVVVAGQVVGKLPLAGPLRVATGQIDVEVSAPGYLRATRSVPIAAGQYQRVLMRLERKPIEPVVVAPVAPVAPVAGVPPAAVAPEPVPQPSGVNWRRVAKWSAFGGAIGMLGLGVTEQVIQLQKACDEYDDTCNDASQRAKTLSLVGYVGAGVLGTTWLVLLLTEPSSSSPKATAWACLPNGPGLACAMRF
jgi:hypothetical protein